MNAYTVSRLAHDPGVMNAAMLTIGKVARKAQVTTDSLRFYEREGLIRPASKTESGYRLYTEEAVRRVAFIKHAQQCGFSLAEIGELLDLRSDDRTCCADVYRVAVEKRLRLEQKIRALNAMAHALDGLIKICSHDEKSLEGCPIVSALEAGLARQRRAAPQSSLALQEPPRKAKSKILNDC